MSGNYLYGVAWTRGEDPEIHHGTVTWYESEGEARFWHRERDDKYWPSTLVRAPLGEIEVVEAGKCPWAGGEVRCETCRTEMEQLHGEWYCPACEAALEDATWD